MKYRPVQRVRLGQQYDWPQAPIPGIIPEEWGLQPVNGTAPPPSPPPGGVIGPAPAISPGAQAPSTSPFPGAVTIPGYIPLPSGGFITTGGVQPSVAPGVTVGPGRFLTYEEVRLMEADEIEEEPSTALKVANWGLLALLLGVGVGAATT